MACTLLPIDSSVCAVSDGGIRVSYIAPLSSVTSLTVASNEVSAFTMAGTGAWMKFVYDTDDDTAYYNQVGERTNKKHTYVQTAFLKFAGIDTTKRIAIDALVGCCEGLVAVHFLNNGETLVQGIDVTAATPFWKTPKKVARVTASIMTGTGAEEDRIEISLISTSNQSSPFGSAAITETYMESL